MQPSKRHWPLLLATLALLVASEARAQEPWLAGATSLPGNSRPLGVGIKLGSPIAATMKYYFTDVHAVEVSVGMGLGGGLAAQTDVSYLYHVYLAHYPRFSLPLYVGAGTRISIWPGEGHYIGHEREGAVGIGFSAPVGIAFNFKRTPMDVFAEVSTGIGVVPSVPRAGLFIDGAAGLRFYF
jgi:hypothetical protein